jgi:hypothetical protein
MIVDAFAFLGVPFDETDSGATAAQMPREFSARVPDEVFFGGVGIICNYNAPPFPSDALQIGNRPLHIQALTIWPRGFADRAAPVVNTGDSHG